MPDVRLIDANALKEAFENEWHLTEYIDHMVDQAPTIDAVPVVRCRECEHYRNKSCPMRALSLMPAGRLQVVDNTYENGFCHMGAKKGGGAEG